MVAGWAEVEGGGLVVAGWAEGEGGWVAAGGGGAVRDWVAGDWAASSTQGHRA